MTDHTSPEGRAELRRLLDWIDSPVPWIVDGESVLNAHADLGAIVVLEADPDDCALIAAAVNALPALLDRIEELEQAKAPRLKLEAQLERAEARVAKLEDLIHTFNAARGMSKPLLCTREAMRKDEEADR